MFKICNGDILLIELIAAAVMVVVVAVVVVVVAVLILVKWHHGKNVPLNSVCCYKTYQIMCYQNMAHHNLRSFSHDRVLDAEQ